jgi:hypothetical protein
MLQCVFSTAFAYSKKWGSTRFRIATLVYFATILLEIYCEYKEFGGVSNVHFDICVILMSYLGRGSLAIWT